METAEIDELLARYSAAEGRIAANLVELDDHPTYCLIVDDALTGATGERLRAYGDAAPTMWVLLDALRNHLEVVRAKRGDSKLNSDRRTQLVHLLTGSSVLINSVATPLAERDLLGSRSVEERVPIDVVVDRIRAVYEPLRDGVASIDAVWRDLLPRIDAASTTIRDLRTELEEIGSTEPLVTMAERALEELRLSVMDDPLGVVAGAGDALDALVVDAANEVGGLRNGHDQLAGDLARTEELIATARVLRSRAATARSDSQAKLAGVQDLAQVPAESFIDELAAQALELRRSEGPWQHTRRWLDQWLDRAERLVEQLHRAGLRNRAPLDRRSELRGLLDAYRAKAASIGRIEDNVVMDLLDEAHAELYIAPTDLAVASALLADLANAISVETSGPS